MPGVGIVHPPLGLVLNYKDDVAKATALNAALRSPNIARSSIPNSTPPSALFAGESITITLYSPSMFMDPFAWLAANLETSDSEPTSAIVPRARESLIRTRLSRGMTPPPDDRQQFSDHRAAQPTP